MALFSVAEAREFRYQGEYQLADVATFPDALIEDAAQRIGEDFARICGVAFEPTQETVELDGPGYDLLALPFARVIAVDAVTRWDGVTWAPVASGYRLTLGGLLLADADYWTRGTANLRVTYTHGYAAVPEPIKRAALILAVNDLTSSNVSDRATQQSDINGTFNLSVAGWRDHAYYGLPVVDSVLARYSERGPKVG